VFEHHGIAERRGRQPKTDQCAVFCDISKLFTQSTFHKCWHSPDKNKVLLKRSNNSPFLMAPIASFLVGYLQLRIPTLHCHQVRCD